MSQGLKCTSMLDTGTSRKEDDASPNDIKAKKDFPYPECWQDDQRMQVLFAPFRVREVNPVNFDAKMKFWRNLIATYCEHLGTVVFSKDALLYKFSRGGTQPKGLDAVIEEMRRMKIIRSREEYEIDPMNSWSGWASIVFVRRPMSWGWHKFKSKIGTLDENQLNALVEYVHIDMLSLFCDRVFAVIFKLHRSKIISYDDLKDCLSSHLDLKEESLCMCLESLNYQRRIGLNYRYIHKKQKIYFIKVPSDDNGNVVISETDMAIYNLKALQSNLLKEIEALETDIHSQREKAMESLKNNRRQIAKLYLRRKRSLENNLEKLSVAMQNVDTILSKIVEAGQYYDILNALKIGSNALQNILDESELTINNVHKVTDQMRNTIEDFAEIEDAMANMELNQSLNNETDKDLEVELQMLIDTEAKEKSDKKLNNNVEAVRNNLTSDVNKSSSYSTTNANRAIPTKEEIETKLQALDNLALT